MAIAAADNPIPLWFPLGTEPPCPTPVCTGLLPGRDADVAGFAEYHLSLRSEVPASEGRYSETAVEPFHEIQPTPEVGPRPDIQYTVYPGGDGHHANVAGFRV